MGFFELGQWRRRWAGGDLAATATATTQRNESCAEEDARSSCERVKGDAIGPQKRPLIPGYGECDSRQERGGGGGGGSERAHESHCEENESTCLSNSKPKESSSCSGDHMQNSKSKRAKSKQANGQ
jgi:hypothetical protein